MTKSKYATKKKNKRLIIVLIIIIIAIIFDLTIAGFLKYGYYVARCGGVPVLIEPGAFAASPVYILPGHYVPGGAASDYVCTEQEAKDRWIQKSLYD